jgi:hypothetical protein
MIRYRMLPNSAFVAGDTETGRTAMAFPRSMFAARAVGAPDSTAATMMRAENTNPVVDAAVDARNWRLIEGD